MAESVYKVIELIGTSKDSWEMAAKAAIDRAGKSLRDLLVAEVVQLDLQMDDGRSKRIEPSSKSPSNSKVSISRTAIAPLIERNALSAGTINVFESACAICADSPRCTVYGVRIIGPVFCRFAFG